MPEPTYGLQHLKKLCCWCNQRKPLTEFYRNPMTKDRLCPQCKVCQKGIVAKHRRKEAPIAA